MDSGAAVLCVAEQTERVSVVVVVVLERHVEIRNTNNTVNSYTAPLLILNAFLQ